jgi:hypothetical protein
LSAPNLGSARSKSLTAPLPVFGLRGEYEIGERFTLRGASQWFGVNTGNIGGRLVDTYIGADYSFGERMAVGLAYNDVSMSISLDKEASDLRGSLDWVYDGILLYVKADFGKQSRQAR